MTTEGGTARSTISIHNLRPLEVGGIAARQGFSYQDHVAVAFYLAMLDDLHLAQVWCETDDDITLIRDFGTRETIEFVQVKHEQLAQLWSAALLCHRDGADQPEGGDTRPRSILERSLAHDRCHEPCSFRLVTSWHVHPDLELLTLPLTHERRRTGEAEFESLLRDIAQRAERAHRYVSDNGGDTAFWVRNVVWEVRELTAAVEHSNLLALDSYIARLGYVLAPDQRAELYEKLLIRARDAAEAPFDPDPTRKKLARQGLLDYVQSEILAAQHPSVAADGTALRGRLVDAGLGDETIENAWDLRRRYRMPALSSRYLSLEDRERVEADVLARLNQLRSAWNAREFDDTPVQFHSRCLHALDELRGQLPMDVPIGILQGMMYDITGRGAHRFTQYGNRELPPYPTDGEGAAA